MPELSLLIKQQTLYLRLTWNNAIPEQEVHLKLGGDAGGGSFKMAFQIANLQHPHSKTNTVVHVPRQRYMDKFKNSINEIQGASKHPKGSYLEVGTYTVNVL